MTAVFFGFGAHRAPLQKKTLVIGAAAETVEKIDN
jgi:hypothetical protein